VSSGETPRWIPLETYLHEETTVQFTHGICPSCAKRLYPELEGMDVRPPS